MIFHCKKCGLALTSDLIELKDEKELCLEDEKDMIQQGLFFISKGEFEPERPGDFIVNLKDLINTKQTKKTDRLIGCCGPDGMAGYNILCMKGHEVGTERSDCWLPHHAVLSHKKLIT